MPWRELEEYRQLLQDYEDARDRYFRAEVEYKAADESKDISAARGAYAALSAEHEALMTLYNQLRQMRKNLADARDASGPLVASLSL